MGQLARLPLQWGIGRLVCLRLWIAVGGRGGSTNKKEEYLHGGK